MANAPYILYSAGSGRKHESVGGLEMIRPAAGAVWNANKFPPKTLEYIRYKDSSGEWKGQGNTPRPGLVRFDIGKDDFLEVETKLTSFGHLGFFAEQATNWKRILSHCKTIGQNNGSCKVLNLFAYTGMSSMAAAKAGVQVTHVDASKSTVAWAKELADLNGLSDAPIRWIVDDVSKYVARELRRGSEYDVVILDPPSFGRGTKSEVWKIEQHLPELMAAVYELVEKRFGFVLLSAHSQGYTPFALQNIQSQQIEEKSLSGISLHSEEMLIPARDGRDLPSGACCWAISSELDHV
jgi:23S rRNA (cytosine1962-C5)-methyltransferase